MSLFAVYVTWGKAKFVRMARTMAAVDRIRDYYFKRGASTNVKIIKTVDWSPMDHEFDD